jgi:phage gp45-like
MSDALYIGGILNQAPTQWLRFHDDEIELFAREDIVVHAKGRDLRIETGRNMDGEIASNVTLKVGNRVEIEVGATINIKAGGTVIVDAPTAHFTGNVNVDGDVRAGTVSLRTHVHSGVMTGPGTSGPPVGG